MSIVVWPEDIVMSEKVICALCGRQILLQEASAGAIDKNGIQSFACKGHLGVASTAIFLRGWAVHAVKMRNETGIENEK